MKWKHLFFFQGRFAIDKKFIYRILLGHEHPSAPPLPHRTTKWDGRQIQSMLMAAAYFTFLSTVLVEQQIKFVLIKAISFSVTFSLSSRILTRKSTPAWLSRIFIDWNFLRSTLKILQPMQTPSQISKIFSQILLLYLVNPIQCVNVGFSQSFQAPLKASFGCDKNNRRPFSNWWHSLTGYNKNFPKLNQVLS